jgi:FlgN protein
VSAPAATTHALPERVGVGVGEEVIAHLDAQVASARSLLGVVLEQGAAIRARDVQAVVRLAGILRGEMGRRELLEEERTRLLARCGERLGVAAETVTLEALLTLLEPARADRAGALSAELKGLLHELQREHTTNRAIMQIELGFLDHLMAMLALDGVNGYDTRGTSTAIARGRPESGGLHVLDLRA